MKIIFELNNKKHLLSPEHADEIMALVHKYGTEVYEVKHNWSTKEDTHHVYEVTPIELGAGEIRYISDALYGMAKLRGRPEK